MREVPCFRLDEALRHLFECIDVALQAVIVLGKAVGIGWQTINRHMYQRLYDIGPASSGQIRPLTSSKRRVEQRQESHLRVDRGNNCLRLDSLTTFEHNGPHSSSEGIDTSDRC